MSKVFVSVHGHHTAVYTEGSSINCLEIKGESAEVIYVTNRKLHALRCITLLEQATHLRWCLK